MEISKAADRLKLSVRHLRRLIKSGAIPAKKTRVTKTIEIDVWEIPDDVVQAASDALEEMVRHENFGEWMVEKVEALGLTLRYLSKRTRLPVLTLLEVAQAPGYLSQEDEEIEMRIVAALLRTSIERRFGNVQQQ